MLVFIFKTDLKICINLTIWVEIISEVDSWLIHFCLYFALKDMKKSNKMILILIFAFINSINKDYGLLLDRTL